MGGYLVEDFFICILFNKKIGILSVALVLDAVYEHLDADEPVPDVHRPGGVDGGGDGALVQAQVVHGAVGGGQAEHLLHTLDSLPNAFFYQN